MFIIIVIICPCILLWPSRADGRIRFGRDDERCGLLCPPPRFVDRSFTRPLLLLLCNATTLKLYLSLFTYLSLILLSLSLKQTNTKVLNRYYRYYFSIEGGREKEKTYYYIIKSNIYLNAKICLYININGARERERDSSRIRWRRRQSAIEQEEEEPLHHPRPIKGAQSTIQPPAIRILPT